MSLLTNAATHRIFGLTDFCQRGRVARALARIASRKKTDKISLSFNVWQHRGRQSGGKIKKMQTY